MHLSYPCRLICLALCSAGLLQLLLECLAGLAAPFLLRHATAANARRGERSLFLLAFFARLSPWIAVLGAWMPAYMHGEDNLSTERVGLFCLAGAAMVLGSSISCGLRALRAWMRTQHCCSLCHEAGVSPDGLPVLLYPGERPLLAVVGVFSSRIIVSESLLVSERFSEEKLDIAFAHEGAHARQRDNLKLLVLSLLPCIPLVSGGRFSLGQYWRLAAEMAADEDGTMGRRDRSVVLAELLVSMARENNGRMPHGSFALLPRAEDLRKRVDRLLQPGRNLAPHTGTAKLFKLHSTVALVSCLTLLAMLCYLCTQLGHPAAETLLHIG